MISTQDRNGPRRALITGITGMMGSHLADYLLMLGYSVYGMERRSSTKSRVNLQMNKDQITFLSGDLTDQSSILNCLHASEPDEFYNLGAQSYVQESWNSPISTMDITGNGAFRCLEAVRQYGKPVKFYQSCSSEQFGFTDPGENGCDESFPFYPRSPYAVAKCAAFHATKNYRESFGIFAANGILFNNESERRGLEFVTRKISFGVAQIHLKKANGISLGNLDARRDWGYSPDYVKAIHAILQQPAADDFVIATGETRSVRNFVELAFREVGIDNWEKYVSLDPKMIRPAEVPVLKGNATKARLLLNWRPETCFESMVAKMVASDVALLSSPSSSTV